MVHKQHHDNSFKKHCVQKTDWKEIDHNFTSVCLGDKIMGNFSFFSFF